MFREIIIEFQIPKLKQVYSSQQYQQIPQTNQEKFIVKDKGDNYKARTVIKPSKAPVSAARATPVSPANQSWPRLSPNGPPNVFPIHTSVPTLATAIPTQPVYGCAAVPTVHSTTPTHDAVPSATTTSSSSSGLWNLSSSTSAAAIPKSHGSSI